MKPDPLVPRRDLATSSLINLMSPWHFEKKKSSNLVRHQRTFSNFFLPTKKLLLFTFWKKCWLLLYRKNQSQYHLVFSVLLNTCFSERDFFSQHPFKCDPHPPWVILPFPTTFPSVCVSHCSFPAGSFSYAFFPLRPCFLEPRLACLIDLISIPDVLPHLPSSGIIGAQKHTCCFTCFDCFLPLTWNN